MPDRAPPTSPPASVHSPNDPHEVRERLDRALARRRDRQLRLVIVACLLGFIVLMIAIVIVNTELPR